MKPYSYAGTSPLPRRLMTTILPFFFLAIHLPFYSIAQGVTGIITDYGGYWKSSQSSINPIRPDNSHNLLAFTWNGVQYSTGANNSVLSSHGQTFTAGGLVVYECLFFHRLPRNFFFDCTWPAI